MSKTKTSATSRRGKASESAGPGSAEDGALSFEGALEQLESTVGRLEEGEMPLEEALALFEAGVKLSRQCTETLEAAEKRIEVLVADREGDGWSAEPFESDQYDDDDDDDDDDDEDFEED